MISSKLFIVGVVSAALVSTLLGEAVKSLPTFTVDTTRVLQSDLQVPFAVSQVGAMDIQRASTQLALDESLQTIPGVFVLNPYNFAQDARIAIRGFGARSNFGIRGIRLIVDGIPATTPDGQGNVDGIDLGSAESVEVLRGPASALYGAASGGVIRIETEAGPQNPFLETRLLSGDYGLRQAQLKAGGEVGAFNYLVSATELQYDGYRDQSKTENRVLNTKFRYSFSRDASLTSTINYIDLPRQDDAGGLRRDQVAADRRQARPENIQYAAGESVEQIRFGLRFEQVINDLHSWDLRAYYTGRDFANRLPFESGGQVEFERDFFGAGASHRLETDALKLTTGFDFDYQDDARARFDNLNGARGALTLRQQETIQSLGFFTSGRYDLSETLALSAAFRQDWVDFEVDDFFVSDGDDSGERRFEASSPMLGISWLLGKNSSVFANVSTSFETPTTTELANPAGGGFNPAVDPQEARSAEFGLKGGVLLDTRRLRYEVTAFLIEIDDALVAYEFGGRDFFRNAGESRRRGLEAAVEYDLAENLRMNVSYTWSDFEYEDYTVLGNDFSGSRLPGIPEHFGHLQLNYENPNGFFLRWDTRFVGCFFADDGNTEKVDRYTKSDLRAGFSVDWEGWTFEPFVGVNNVFDTKYDANIRINAFGGRYYEPAPERNLYAGIRLRYSFE